MKLHLGCGDIKLQGYVNIDIYEDSKVKPDRIFDISNPLDYDDNSVGEIIAVHVIEHLPFPSVGAAVKSWYRVLKDGGVLVIECPDFDALIGRLSVNPNDFSSLIGIFGEQDRLGQTHYWGWNKDRLEELVRSVGFRHVIFTEPLRYYPGEASIALQAKK